MYPCTSRRLLAPALLATLAALVPPSPPATYAQDPSEELGTWIQYFGDNRISDRFSLHTEVEYWLWEAASNPHVLIVRPAVNFHLKGGPFFTVGYTYVKSWPFEEEGVTTSQNHLFEQLILRSPVWRIRFFHRYRFEQRWIKFGDAEGTDFSTRLRYMLLVQLPLTRPAIEPNTLYFTTYNELFLNTSGRDDVFDQNRLYLALAYQITGDFCVQTGFLFQMFDERTFERLQFVFFYNPNLR